MYGIREISELAGVSARTLRYYDEIGLLRPLCVNEAGYRYYGEKEVAMLQQILFYRERGFDLKQIRQILYEDDFDLMTALQQHLQDLESRRNHMDAVINTVQRTIMSMKGECSMSNEEKFAALKEKAVTDNEAAYGEEIREKYGDEAVDATNRKLLQMSEQEWEKFTSLEQEILRLLEQGVAAGMRPDSEGAKKIVLLHKEWLCMTWKKYTPEAHQGLAQMYVSDERFRTYYDKKVSGCAELLSESIQYWTAK